MNGVPGGAWNRFKSVNILLVSNHCILFDQLVVGIITKVSHNITYFLDFVETF